VLADHRCIDCQTCRWMAPEVFKRVDGKAAVAAQPSSQEETTKALQALLSCPTSSIHTHKPPPKEVLVQVQDMFPLPLDDNLLPVRASFLLMSGNSSVSQSSQMPIPPCSFQGVYLCGYHSQHSFGATSYLVTHPQGNILVDR
jgi:ferredoxin